jgi:TonB family protein
MKSPLPRCVLLIILAALTPATVCFAQRSGGGGGRGGGGGGGGGRGGGGGGETEPGLRLLNSPNWVYPFDLAKAGTTGTAEITYFVDPTGKTITLKVVKATKPEFGLAAIAVLEQARYSPQINDKTKKPEKSVEQRITLPFNKEKIDTEALEMLAKPEGVLFNVAELDSKSITPIAAMPHPNFPEALAKKKVATGEARIEIIIDKTGVVRVPRIVSASEPEFGWSAATMALTYQFSRPVKDGKPVAVKLTLPFKFNLADDLAAAAGTATPAAPAASAPAKK